MPWTLPKSTLEQVVEAILFSQKSPLTIQQIIEKVNEELRPDYDEIQQVLAVLQERYVDRCYQLTEVATGFRLQIKPEMNQYFVLAQSKPARFSRALLETLAIIAYRQPVTRAEIEAIRGVAVTSHIMKTLTEKGWVHSAGRKDVPGRPLTFVTTNQFLNDFSLKTTQDLPPLEDFIEIEQLEALVHQEVEQQMPPHSQDDDNNALKAHTRLDQSKSSW